MNSDKDNDDITDNSFADFFEDAKLPHETVQILDKHEHEKQSGRPQQTVSDKNEELNVISNAIHTTREERKNGEMVNQPGQTDDTIKCSKDYGTDVKKKADTDIIESKKEETNTYREESPEPNDNTKQSDNHVDMSMKNSLSPKQDSADEKKTDTDANVIDNNKTDKEEEKTTFCDNMKQTEDNIGHQKESPKIPFKTSEPNQSAVVSVDLADKERELIPSNAIGNLQETDQDKNDKNGAPRHLSANQDAINDGSYDKQARFETVTATKVEIQHGNTSKHNNLAERETDEAMQTPAKDTTEDGDKSRHGEGEKDDKHQIQKEQSEHQSSDTTNKSQNVPGNSPPLIYINGQLDRNLNLKEFFPEKNGSQEEPEGKGNVEEKSKTIDSFVNNSHSMSEPGNNKAGSDINEGTRIVLSPKNSTIGNGQSHLGHEDKTTSGEPFAKQPSASGEPSDKQPSASREPSDKQPSASREPSGKQPSVSREPSDKQPSTSREPSDKQPSASREPSDKQTSYSIEPSDKQPSASREPPDKQPSASRDPSDKQLLASSEPSDKHNQPSLSREPSDKQPSASRESSDQQSSTSSKSSDKQHSTPTDSSDKQPSTSREPPSDKQPSASRESSDQKSSTSREPSDKQPSASRESSDQQSSTSSKSSDKQPPMPTASSDKQPSASRESSDQQSSTSSKSSDKQPPTPTKSSDKQPSASRESSDKQSSTSREPSDKHKVASMPRETSDKQLSMHRDTFDKQPLSASREPSNKQHSMSKESSNKQASTSREISDEQPSTPREPSDKQPSTFEHQTHKNSPNSESTIEQQNTQSSKDKDNSEMTMGMFEQSHSMYFTGRLPTLDPTGSVTPNKDPDEQGPHLDDTLVNENERNSKQGEISSNGDHVRAESANDSLEEREDTTKNDGDDIKRVSTPSREIKKLIQEINAPAQIYKLSKEKPLSPYDKYQSNNELSNLTEQSEENENREASKHVTVSDLNTVTSDILFEDYEKQSAAKYDDLPHMKKILEYTVENQLRDPGHTNDIPQSVPRDDTVTHITRTVTEITDEKTNEAHPNDNVSATFEIEQTALANQQNNTAHEDFVKKTSRSETDLKEMIASAKRAIRDDETVVEGTSGVNSTVYPSSSGAWKTDESTYGSQYDGLICSRCLRLDSDFAASGFCHECQEYLCGQCRKLHKESSATMHHYVMDSYCTNELKVRKYIRATSYCRDCEIFLCGKCSVQHTGFRSFRRHKIIQSSFISRQTQSKTSTESTVSLDDTAKTEVEEQESAREHDEMKQQKRKKYVFDKLSNSPYGSKFDNVPESIYPGKNKKLAISYTSSPHWPFSSIPSLPYLVKPGNLQQRALKTPYLQDYKTPFYTKTKKAFDVNAIKLKALQLRYNVEPERKTFRRKEMALFTARPLRNPEGTSLPNISSFQSYNVERRSSHYGPNVRKKVEKTKPSQASNKLKTAEFIRDECLSIPFPSNELPCLIGGMVVLFDGRLVVLDKRNNNIKLFSRKFSCQAALQFQNRIVDICTSSIYPTDVYLATPKHLYEINAKKGMEITRKMKVEIKRIEGLVCWKYGIAIISMKTDLSWEIRLLDFRGNLKSKLEIMNPFTCEIERSNRYHVVASRGGKYLTLSDTKNACAICVDVTTRCVVSETLMLESKKPSFLATDHQHNVYISCGDEVQQVSAKGNNLGIVVKLEKEKVGRVGCIAYNTANDRLYVQMKSDVIAIYRMSV